MHDPSEAGGRVSEGDIQASTGELTIDFASGRVLGCLIEKAMTTPDHYPMSLNAVVVACNQVSNREPVVRLDEPLVERTLRVLADQGLAKMVHRPGDRVVKYRQAVEEVLSLSAPEAALIAVLMLRGPQTPGELRQRTTRYVDFPTLFALETSLGSLQTRTTPLVERLDRRPGQKEYRYRQRFATEDQAARPSPHVDGSPAYAEQVSPELGTVAGVAEAEAPDESELEKLRVRIEAIEQRVELLLHELGLEERASGTGDAGNL